MRSERGFSLQELVATVALLTTLAAMAAVALGGAAERLRADGQVQRLIGLIQLARETAIMRQRDVEIVFDTANQRARLVIHDNGTQIQFREVGLEYGVGFRRFSGNGDTPQGFGANADVDFGGAARLLFISDGSLVDDTDVPANGTIYLGIANKRDTARAITIIGTTARPRIYSWANGWV